ncbi:RHS repeat-associated core domain-containing protein [Pseudomonas sp. efr-133-TYG-103a]|uniref:RHS repeat-associated core domain-containing protein n=1 Tax=Pseudomonas sp. efr-133-TYG-103a TaxID=3040308 RepID=UPI0025529DBC|nr:RHS repeat-associated core domain-containing protein [Pseudomonas sp. efr-133-TYG-103a]
MSDALWAARVGDALSHTSLMADVFGGVLEVAANIAIGAVATAAVVAATGLTVATGGIGACVLGAVVGLVVGVAMSKTGADKGLGSLCEDIGNGLFPATVQANISTGSSDTFINGLPAARAAGSVPFTPAAAGSSDSSQTDGFAATPEDESGFLDMAMGFFSQMWRPTVARPGPGVAPKPLDLLLCTRHPPMPPQMLAEGSAKVTINGQPAVRSGDRSTCDATVVSSGLISPNVRIGGGKVVVREIRSGKTPGVGLAVTALMMLKGRRGTFQSNLPCMLLGGVNAFAVSSAMGALTHAIAGSPNPVHAATGAKVLGGAEELDFVLPGILPIDWQRFYNSRDERRNGMFGTGWSVAYEVNVRIDVHPDGGERLIYIDEQARSIDMGSVPPGGAVFSAGEGLAVRRHDDGQLLIESQDGIYRLFEPAPGDATYLRLTQLGDRNDNRIYLNYDSDGRLIELRDTFDLLRVSLVYSGQWPSRVERIERTLDDQTHQILASYAYDACGDLAEVRDALGAVQRRFVYDPGGRMVEHRLPTGLRCFYEWALLDGLEWRVIRHWTDEGDEYHFDYDLNAGSTRITDSLHRCSTRLWNSQHQITEYADTLGQTWRFIWNDERQLLSAVDPHDGEWRYSYDDAGNLIGTQDPLGRQDATVWLEHWSLPRVATDAAGNSWHYHYDSRGNCTRETDPLGHVTRYRYDERGQVVEIVDAIGKRKQLRWNDFGQLTEHVDCSGYSTSFNYDSRGYLQGITDALGECTTFEHDAQERLLRSHLADGRVEHYLRDASGLLTGYTDPAGHTTRYEYDRRGQVRQRLDAHNRRVRFSYDAYGRLHALSNENGESYRFAWDAGDRLVAQQDLDGSQRHYSYDGLNNPVRVEHLPAPDDDPRMPASIVHSLERDPVGRLTAKITADGRTEYRYNAMDQLIEVTFTDVQNGQQCLGFDYDAAGRLRGERSAGGSLQHHYDELGNLIQTHLPDGRWLNRLHYGSGHLHQINLDGQVISDFERDRLHREVLRSQGQITTRSQYDRCGRLRARMRRPTHQPPQLPAQSSQEFQYDPCDNLTGRLYRSRPQDRRTLLHYDATSRIIASQDSIRGDNETFAYDAAANLLDGSHPEAGLIRHNRLLTYQDKRYRYDGFGRLIEKRSMRHGIQRFAYDAESRLIEVHNPNGHVVRMSYDPLGRRIGKSEYNGRGQRLSETRFMWDRLRLLHEQRNSLSSLYVYADGSHEPLARIDGSGALQTIRYYHNDLNGLPEQLTETDGRTVWQARYHVWGNTCEETREPYFIEEQNLRFQGQYLDRETGLHYNTFRFYDPDIGRFTTPDPIGLLGGLNLYQYAPNPVGWVDPWGLAACGKNIDALRNGPQKTTVSVKTKGEAHELVMEAFPDAQKVRGIGSQDAAGIRKKFKMEQFKKKDGKVRYRKDYPIDRATGRVFGHDDPKGTGHGELPHINIKRADGTMVRIDITS